MTRIPASSERPNPASRSASQTMDDSGVPSTAVPAAVSTCTPLMRDVYHGVGRVQLAEIYARTRHERPLLGVVRDSQVQVRGDVVAAVHDLEGGRHDADRPSHLLQGHTRSDQGVPHREAELALDARRTQVRVTEHGPARAVATPQQEAEHRLMDADLLLDGPRSEADLPSGMAIAGRLVPVGGARAGRRTPAPC